MFESKNQFQALKKLWAAMDEAEASPPCENYPEAFHPDYSQSGSMLLNNAAKSLCAECPVIAQCAEYGIRWERQGIYGGISPRDRQKLRSKLKAEGHYLPDLNDLDEVA